MTLNEAIIEMRKDKVVARRGWNIIGNSAGIALYDDINDNLFFRRVIGDHLGDEEKLYYADIVATDWEVLNIKAPKDWNR